VWLAKSCETGFSVAIPGDEGHLPVIRLIES
jgi:hypothetical protein